MQSLNQANTLSLLENLCQTSADPLALVDQTGAILTTNEVMQRRLAELSQPLKLLAAFGESSQPRSRKVSLSGAHGRSLNLLRLPLGPFYLITLVEGHDDARIQRLRQRLEQAEKESITDALTGIWNRLQFDQIMRTEVPRSQRYRQPLSLAIIDIDHFKRINDEFGHAAGDQTLKELVKLIQSRIRVVDSLFRWGGEEFALLLPNTGLSAARLTAERLRQAVAAHDFSAIGKLTISLGIAELRREETAEVWFKRTDQALYEAKAGGRNQVVCAPANAREQAMDSSGESLVFLPWKAEYECGHSLIDSQHQRLFELGNRLISASLDPDTQAEGFLARVDQLLEHVGQHFTDEENILESIGYGDLLGHRRAHRSLLDKAAELRRKAEAATISSGEVIDFLVNSVVKNHMLTADKAFFEHLLPEAVEP